MIRPHGRSCDVERECGAIQRGVRHKYKVQTSVWERFLERHLELAVAIG